MKWYYKKQGIHVHVRVYVNGALCGNLCFRTAEFADFEEDMHQTDKDGRQPIEFIEDKPEPSVYDGMTEEEKRYAHNSQVRQMMDDGA